MGILSEFKIIKLSKHLDFPLTSKINEGGVRYFINDMENELFILIKSG